MKRIITLFFSCFTVFLLQAQNVKSDENDGIREREYLVKTLIKIADPVLDALSKNELRKKMPVEAKIRDRPYYTHLEAFGRLLSGMAPWLELGPDNTAEGKLRKKYINLARQCLHNATDTSSVDFLNFNRHGNPQPLVDAAFLAQALLRSPTQLWDPLDAQTKKNIIAALKSTRSHIPSYGNWLLFSATIEAALMKFGADGDRMRIEYAVRKHLEWYLGDGVYGDGPTFHFDYYNSFVIHPMLLDVLDAVNEADSLVMNESHWKKNAYNATKSYYDTELARAQRYAEIQERLISPEGTYPPVGRSLAYRFGAFQSLAQIAVMEKLLPKIKPQQVRAALYTVIKKQIEAPGTFDENGWLTVGFYGHQPSIGEAYVSTGSLYLCSEAFLILGLPASNAFWQGRDEDWTAKKVWNGVDIPVDRYRGKE